jgi:hypothetical protein
VVHPHRFIYNHSLKVNQARVLNNILVQHCDGSEPQMRVVVVFLLLIGEDRTPRHQLTFLKGMARHSQQVGHSLQRSGSEWNVVVLHKYSWKNSAAVTRRPKRYKSVLK